MQELRELLGGNDGGRRESEGSHGRGGAPPLLEEPHVPGFRRLGLSILPRAVPGLVRRRRRQGRPCWLLARFRGCGDVNKVAMRL